MSYERAAFMKNLQSLINSSFPLDQGQFEKIKDIPVKVEAFEQFARAAALWGFSLPAP